MIYKIEVKGNRKEMSNKQVPAVYRTIINQVIESVRPDFDDAGVEEAVLQELLRSWESKVAVSRVADFSSDPRMGPLAKQFPMLTTIITPPVVPVPATTTDTTTTTTPTVTPAVTGDVKNEAPAVASGSKGNGKTVAAKVTKEVTEGEDGPVAEKKDEDGDEINSDLDDPEEEIDDEDDEPGAESGDLVIALYEKVQRVKNKWKVTLKDGLISVGGKEYLFAKCSGEFEW